jgi:hypothetical protein
MNYFTLECHCKGGPDVRFGSKADICSALANVRFVPIADSVADRRKRQKPRRYSRGFAHECVVKGTEHAVLSAG